MNNARRKQIEEAVAKVQAIREYLEEAAREVVDLVETIRDEEQEYFDAMPEAIQGSEKGDAATARIDSLEEALSSLEDLSGTDFDAITDALETAKE